MVRKSIAKKIQTGKKITAVVEEKKKVETGTAVEEEKKINFFKKKINKMLDKAYMQNEKEMKENGWVEVPLFTPNEPPVDMNYVKKLKKQLAVLDRSEDSYEGSELSNA